MNKTKTSIFFQPELKLPERQFDRINLSPLMLALWWLLGVGVDDAAQQYQTAIEAYERGDSEFAIKLLEKLVVDFSPEVVARLQGFHALGVLCMKLGQMSEALGWFEKQAEYSDKIPLNTLEALAVLHLFIADHGDQHAGFAYLEQAIRLGSHQAQLMRAIHQSSSDPVAADRLLQEISENFSAAQEIRAAASYNRFHLKKDSFFSTGYPPDTFDHLKQAAELGHYEARLIIGCWYYDKADYREAARYLNEPGPGDDLSALKRLGNMYAEGLGVDKDSKKALNFWKRALAINPNDIEIHAFLGSYYFNRDQYAEALPFLRVAQRNLEARMLLAQMYARGLHVKQDIRGAIELGEPFAAAHPEHYIANEFIAGLFYRSAQYKKAVEYYSRAAVHSDSVEAPRILGMMSFTGTAGKRDVIQAVKWFRIGAERNDPVGESQFFLALALEMGGHGLSADPGEVLKWYKIAAQKGYPGADDSVTRLEPKQQGGGVFVQAADLDLNGHPVPPKLSLFELFVRSILDGNGVEAIRIVMAAFNGGPSNMTSTPLLPLAITVLPKDETQTSPLQGLFEVCNVNPTVWHCGSPVNDDIFCQTNDSRHMRIITRTNPSIPWSQINFNEIYSCNTAHGVTHCVGNDTETIMTEGLSPATQANSMRQLTIEAGLSSLALDLISTFTAHTLCASRTLTPQSAKCLQSALRIILLMSLSSSLSAIILIPLAARQIALSLGCSTHSARRLVLTCYLLQLVLSLTLTGVAVTTLTTIASYVGSWIGDQVGKKSGDYFGSFFASTDHVTSQTSPQFCHMAV